MRRLLVGLALVVVACGESITIPYNQYIGITGTWELRTVNDKPLPSAPAPYLNAQYQLDSARLVFTDSTFADIIYYRVLTAVDTVAAGDTILGTYRVDGDNVRFYAIFDGYSYNAAFLKDRIVMVYQDGHTLIYNKR